MLRLREFRIVGDDGLCNFPGTVEDGIIPDQVCNPEVERNSTLLCTLQVTRTAQFQIGLGNNETVVALGHDLHPLSGIGREFIRGDQDTVGLVGTTPYPASQLM